MALINPPLFMQTGRYTAERDRLLIGALLAPAGGSSQGPRVGVRPSGVVDGQEVSLRVVPGETAGKVRVLPGAAFVAAPGASRLDGVYLVVNDADQEVDVSAAGGAGSGEVNVYLQVRDAQFEATEGELSSLAEAKFLVSPDLSATPSGALLLARVKWSAGTAAEVVSDDRVYTAGAGGVVRVASEGMLLKDAPSTWHEAPFGALAYAHSGGVLHIRTSRGWEPVGVPLVGETAGRPPSSGAYDGMLYFDRTRDLLQIYSASDGGWLSVGERPSIVSKTVQGLNGGSGRVVKHIFGGSHCWLKFAATGFMGFEDARITVAPGVGSIAKPNAETFAVRVRVFTANTVVTAVLSASGWVPKGSTVGSTVSYDSNSNANLAIDIKKYDGNGNPSLEVDDPTSPGKKYATSTYDSGLTFYEKQDALKSRTVHYQLMPGDYLFNVKASHSGDASGSMIFQMHQCIFEVAA